MTQQFMQQYRHLMVAELSFVRMACSDLTPEQRPLIRARAEASLKKAAREMAKMQNRQMLGGIQIVTDVQPQPNKTIREGIAEVLAETLTEEQMAKYKTEADDRVATRKHAAILCCVAHLDSALCLTSEQREKIIGTISTNWQETWENWLMLSNYGDQYFPTLPDQNIVPHLTKEQKSVWQGLQKIDFGNFWGGGGHNEFNSDGWWGNDVDQSQAEPAVARPAEIQEPGL